MLPPRWADVGDEVTELLGDIARKSQALERLHQKHVLPVFGDDESDDDDDVNNNNNNNSSSSAAAARRAEEAEIERLTQAITRGFHDCHRAIQRVERMVRDNGKGVNQTMMTRAEETMAKNVQISLAARVQEASANFRKKQSAYLKSMLFSFLLLLFSKCISVYLYSSIYIFPPSAARWVGLAANPPDEATEGGKERLMDGCSRLYAYVPDHWLTNQPQNSAGCPASARTRPYQGTDQPSPHQR